LGRVVWCKFIDFPEVLDSIIIALIMEAESAFETTVNFYQSTRRNSSAESHVRTQHRENLKFHLLCFVL
jgi:hypothetical protein